MGKASFCAVSNNDWTALERIEIDGDEIYIAVETVPEREEELGRSIEIRGPTLAAINVEPALWRRTYDWTGLMLWYNYLTGASTQVDDWEDPPDDNPHWDELPDSEVHARQDWDFITENGVKAFLLKERL